MFSGGSLLFGATGRPDLLGPDHTHDLVRHQHASAHRLADLLPDEAEVYPTHGFGSFCSATQSEATASTIGQEKQAQPGADPGRGDLRRELLAGLGAWPAYYAHMAPANAAGPAAPDLSAPAPADAAELRRRIEAGEWVVDLRTRTAFAAGHVPRHAELRPRRRLRDLPRLADRLGHAADPARRDRRAGRRGPARAGPHRHRPARGRTPPARPEDWTDRRSWAGFPTGHVRRPRPGPPPPRGGRPRRPPRPRSTTRARIEGAVNIPLHELLGAAGRGPGRRGVGALRRRLPRLGRRVVPRRRRPPLVAVDDSFDNAAEGRAAPGGHPRRDRSLLAVVAGALIGLSLGALGGGGSILAVPVLVYVLGQSPAQATTGRWWSSASPR